MKDKLVKQFVILSNNTEVFVTTDLAKAQMEYGKQKYLLSFDSIPVKGGTRADEVIEEYISTVSAEEFDPKKAQRVIIERVHKNKAARQRTQLVSRYVIPD